MTTRFVLIQPSHAGNVGAVARAMKVMGFDDLVLVAPRWANVLRREEAIQRASGARDVLDNARIVDTLDAALDGVAVLCATAMTPRDFGPPTMSPRECFTRLVQGVPLRTTGGAATDVQQPPAAPPSDAAAPSVAFLFGPERFGMRNEDVYRCHVALCIPTNPDFGSLNLAAAVQVIAYEWRQALAGYALRPPATSPQLADGAQVAGLLAHWEQALQAIGYLDPDAPKKLMPRLNQLVNRAAVTADEVHILRGVAKAMLQAVQRPRD